MQRQGQVSSDISQYAGSVGCLVDRCLKQQSTLGTAWMMSPTKVATCAHLVVLYADCLPALKVRFPAAGQEREVVAINFHPKFNAKSADQMARKALTTMVPALALQEHNVAVLTLGGGPTDISSDQVAAINERLSSPPPPRDKGLGGSLADIDLPLIIQTITNARKEGTLILSDERNRALAKLFCRDGKILHAGYGPLANETAIYQIVSQHLVGNFYFNSCKNPDWLVQGPIGRPTDMLLIEAHRRLDEIPKLLLELGGDTTIYQRAADNPHLDVMPPDVHKDVQRLWPFLDGKIPIGQLWRLARMDDYAVFLTLSELLKANHIQEVQLFDAVFDYDVLPLKMAPEEPLAPFDDIQNLTVDPLAGHSQINTGHLLGSLRPGDPWHLLHNLDLNADAAGSPIFKDGRVIGIHCGQLPANPSATSGSNQLNQLLWVESVYECMEGTRAHTEQLSLTTTRVMPAGCTEVARIDCKRCGASSLDSAKFCKSCGEALIQDFDFQVEDDGSKNNILKIVAAVLAILLIGGGIFWGITSMHPQEKPVVAQAAKTPRLGVKILKADTVKLKKWVPMPDKTLFHNGDMVAIEMTPASDSFIYILYDKGLIFPDSQDADMKYPKDRTLTCPRETSQTIGGAVSFSGMKLTGPPSTENLVFVVSDYPSSIFLNQALVAKVFEKATAALNSAKSDSGVEVPPTFFGPEVFPSAGKGTDASPVYLIREAISHD